MTPGHVAVAPDAAHALSLDRRNFGITLQNSPVLQLQQVEALLTGGANFLDASDKRLRVRKVLAREIPHLAWRSPLQNLLRNLPHSDILLVTVGDPDFFVGHQEGVR